MTRRPYRPTLGSLCSLGFGLWLSSAAGGLASAAPSSATSPPFGFDHLEIFKTTAGARCLRVTDLDGDGRSDLVLVNEAEGAVEMWLQTSPSARASASAPARTGLHANEVSSDSRFEVTRFHVQKAITALEVGDFDGDGKNDLAFLASPAELEVVYQDESWGSRRWRYPVADGNPSPLALKAADLDGDGRLDLVMLGKGSTYLLYQKKEGGLGPPRVLHDGTASLAAVEVADLDADGRADLLTFDPSSERPVRVRRQGPAGFGPEQPCRLDPIYAWNLSSLDLPGRGLAPTLLAVQKRGSRVMARRWRRRPNEGGVAPALILAARAGADAKKCRRLVADIDGDGRVDIATGYPRTAQVEVVFQTPSGRLAPGSVYPTLSEVSGLAAADVDGDGKPELISISRKEKAIGIARWDGKGLPFPRTWQLAEPPLLVAAAPLRASKAGSAPEKAAARIFLVSESRPVPRLSLVRLGESGNGELEATADLPLPGTPPGELRVFDADGDGDCDAMVLASYADPVLLLQEPASDEKATVPLFREISRAPGFGLGQVSKLEPAALSVVSGAGSVAGPAGAGNAPLLLVGAGNYARALRLGKDHRLAVVAQFNGTAPSSRITASTLLDTDGDGRREIILIDESSHSIDVFRRNESGEQETISSTPLPKIDLVRLRTADLDGDGRDDLVLVGKTRHAIIRFHPEDEAFVEVATFSIDEEEDIGRPRDLAVGDLNGDSRPDVVVETAPRYHLLCLEPRSRAASGAGPVGLRFERRLSFPIFEEKSYMRRAGGYLGPRETLVADVDGDGLQDLLLLIHDRVLLYRQDAMAPSPRPEEHP